MKLEEAWEEYKRLKAEGAKLHAEGRECWAQADRLWDKAVRDAYRYMPYEWRKRNTEGTIYECLLANGDVYRSPREESV